MKNSKQLEYFIANSLAKSRHDLSERFDDAILHFRGDAIQKYRTKYILSKLSQHIEINADNRNNSMRSLEYFMNLEIEHIYPKKPSDRAREEFGESADDAIAERLGNLVLVEKSINSSLGNRPYSQKRPVYNESKLLLTRAISKKPQIGTRTRIDRAVQDLPSFEIWNESMIKSRQKFLHRLACCIWDVKHDP